MVVRRKDKNGRYYYYNKRTKKMTSKRGWKISLVRRKKKKLPPPPKEEAAITAYTNNDVYKAISNYLIDLDLKVFIQWGGKRIKRIFKKDVFSLSWMIKKIQKEYFKVVRELREQGDDIPSPHVIFYLKQWIKRGEIDFPIDETQFVGVDPLMIPLWEIYKRYF